MEIRRTGVELKRTFVCDHEPATRIMFQEFSGADLRNMMKQLRAAGTRFR